MQVTNLVHVQSFFVELFRPIFEEVIADSINKISSQSPTPEPDRWFTIQELCDYLPDRPAIATIYGKVHTNTIPFNKTGKHLRFLKSDIDLWLKEGRRKTIVELQAEANNYSRKK